MNKLFTSLLFFALCSCTNADVHISLLEPLNGLTVSATEKPYVWQVSGRCTFRQSTVEFSTDGGTRWFTTQELGENVDCGKDKAFAFEIAKGEFDQILFKEKLGDFEGPPQKLFLIESLLLQEEEVTDIGPRVFLPTPTPNPTPSPSPTPTPPVSQPNNPTTPETPPVEETPTTSPNPTPTPTPVEPTTPPTNPGPTPTPVEPTTPDPTPSNPDTGNGNNGNNHTDYTFQKRHNTTVTSRGYTVMYTDELKDFYSFKLSIPATSFKYFFSKNSCSFADEATYGSPLKETDVLVVPKKDKEKYLCISGYSALGRNLLMGEFQLNDLLK